MSAPRAAGRPGAGLCLPPACRAFLKALERYRYWHGPRVDGVTAMAVSEFSTFAKL